jgi:hypothetical protein
MAVVPGTPMLPAELPWEAGPVVSTGTDSA